MRKNNENQTIIKESSKRWILLFLALCLIMLIFLTYIFHLTKRIDSLEQSQENTSTKIQTEEALPPQFNTLLLNLKETQYKQNKELSEKNKEIINQQLRINNLLMSKETPKVMGKNFESQLTSTSQLKCLSQYKMRFKAYCQNTYSKESNLSIVQVATNKNIENYYSCNQKDQVKEILRWSDRLVYLKCK